MSGYKRPTGYFLMSAASTVLLIPYVRHHFHGDALSVGLLSASGAVGALVGAVLSFKAQQPAPAYDVLGPAERHDLVLLLQPLARAASAELPYPNAMGLPSL